MQSLNKTLKLWTSLSEEPKIPYASNQSKNNFVEKTNSSIEKSDNPEKYIVIKKSTYNNLVKGLIAVITAAAFFGGYAIGTFDDSDSEITAEEIKEIISEIEINTVPVPQPTQQPTQPSAPQITQVSFDGEPFKGNPNAPVTVVEFSDFQCPFCSRFYQQTLPLIEVNYIDTGKIKFVYRDMPLDNLHPNARSAHIASECADEQGAFWPYHDMLFLNQGAWNRLAPEALNLQLIQYAVSLELDIGSFETCLGSEEIASEISQDLFDASRYGATGTPTFFIGNEQDGFVKLVGAQPYASFQSLIDEKLS